MPTFIRICFPKKQRSTSNRLSSLIAGQRSLIPGLPAVFEWIDFSLEEDKAGGAKIAAQRTLLENEILSLEKQVILAVKTSDNHYMRGHTLVHWERCFLFFGIWTAAWTMRLVDGWKTIITNLYLIRRWHYRQTDRLAAKRDRRQLRRLWNNCVAWYNKAIAEFQAVNDRADVAFAEYGLSVKFAITFRFRLARRLLETGEGIGAVHKEKRHFSPRSTNLKSK